jgi:hypothetical protein
VVADLTGAADRYPALWAVIDAGALGGTLERSRSQRVAWAERAAREGWSYCLLSVPRDAAETEPFPEADLENLAAIHPSPLQVRAGQVFGPGSDQTPDFEASVRASAASSRAEDGWSYGPDLIHMAFDLLIDGDSGVFALRNELAEQRPGAFALSGPDRAPFLSPMPSLENARARERHRLAMLFGPVLSAAE